MNYLLIFNRVVPLFVNASEFTTMITLKVFTVALLVPIFNFAEPSVDALENCPSYTNSTQYRTLRTAVPSTALSGRLTMKYCVLSIFSEYSFSDTDEIADYRCRFDSWNSLVSQFFSLGRKHFTCEVDFYRKSCEVCDSSVACDCFVKTQCCLPLIFNEHARRECHCTRSCNTFLLFGKPHF